MSGSDVICLGRRDFAVLGTVWPPGLVGITRIARKNSSRSLEGSSTHSVYVPKVLGDQGAGSERYEEENMGRGSETPDLEHEGAMGECAYLYHWGGDVCGTPPWHGPEYFLLRNPVFWVLEACTAHYSQTQPPLKSVHASCFDNLP